MPADWTFALGMVVTSVLAALASLILTSAFQNRATAKVDSVFQKDTLATTFLFDGDALLDATPSARFMLASSVVRGGPWFRLLARLGPVFPELEARVLTLHTDGQFLLQSRNGVLPQMVLRGEHIGGLTRLNRF